MHTKGEWVVKDTDIYLNIDGKFTGYKLARVQRSVCFDIKLSKEEVQANARLMAASPKLLEELINAREVLVEQCGIESDCELVLAIDKILMKVKGE